MTLGYSANAGFGLPTLSAAPAELPKPPAKTSVTVKPSPKAEVGRSADCSRTPVAGGAGLGLWLSGEAAAEPAIPSESAVAVAMTAIALNFTLSSRTRSRLARPSGEQP